LVGEPAVKAFAVVAFFAGLLLGVRVMFFGVRRLAPGKQLLFPRWPLATAAFLMVAGAMLYVRVARTGVVGIGWVVTSVLVGALAGGAAWWLVHLSATIPSSDPEDDPRYRFQGQVARLTEAIEPRNSEPPTGRLVFVFDGQRYEFRARWSPGDWRPEHGRTDSEVVIERVDDDLAFVEPWAAIEERL
jgi:hypothetical protein